jgi:hypothetical protein
MEGMDIDRDGDRDLIMIGLAFLGVYMGLGRHGCYH